MVCVIQYAVIRAAYIPPTLANDARMDGAPEFLRPVMISEALRKVRA